MITEVTAKSQLYDALHANNFQYQLINQGVMTFHKWSKYLPPVPARILEFGCGNGFMCRVLAKMGYDVTGYDISGDYEHIGYEFTKEPVYHVCEYDCIVSFDVFEHLNMEELRDILPPLFERTGMVIASIGCYAANRLLHETVLSPEEWLKLLNEIYPSFQWEVIEVFQRHTEGNTPVMIVKGE